MDIVERYFLWNDGFIDYYFGNGANGDEKIKLIIDESIINEVGAYIYRDIPEEEHPDCYKEDFISAVLCPKKYREQNKYCFPRSLDCTNDFPTVRELMERYAEASIACAKYNAGLKERENNRRLVVYNRIRQQLPCLNHVLLLLLLFHEMNRTEGSILDYIRYEFCHNYGRPLNGHELRYEGVGTFNFNIVRNLYDAVKSYSPLFDDFWPEGAQPYVNFLRYHQILTSQQAKRLKEILNSKNFSWDENLMTYEYVFENLIRPELDIRNNVDRELYSALCNESNYRYFESKLSLFESDEENGEITQHYGCLLLHGIFDEKGNCEWSFLTDLKVSGDSECLCFENNDLKIPFIFDSFDSIFPVVNKRQVTLSNYYRFRLEEDNYTFKTYTGNQGYLLFVNQENELVQRQYPYQNQRQYYIITKNEIQPVDNVLFGQSVQQLAYLNVGEGWSIYYVDCWIFLEGEDLNWHATDRIQLRNGIKDPTDLRRYLVGGLPFITIPNSVENINLSVIAKDIDNPNASVEISTFDVGNNQYAMTLPESLYKSRHIELKISVKDNEYTFGMMVTLSTEIMPTHHCRFDEWGDILNSDRSSFYSDGKVVGGNSYDNSENYRYIDNIANEPTSKCGVQLLDLIYNWQVLSDNDFIPEPKVNSIIEYLARINNIARNVSNCSSLRNAMVELGFLDKHYVQDKPIYQVVTPKLVKAKFSQESDTYILYGSYSQSIYNKLVNSDASVSFRRVVSGKYCEMNPYMSLLPDYICLRKRLSDSSEYLGIEVSHHPLAYDLIGYVANVSGFKSHYLSNDIIADEEYPKYIRGEKGQRSYLEFANDRRVYNSCHDGIYNPIPVNYMRLFERVVHNKPVIYINASESKRIYFTSEMGMPTLLKRALYEVNQELAEKRYYFGLDGLFGEGNPLYMKIACVRHCPEDMIDTICKKLTGGNSNKITIVDDGWNPQLNMKLLIIKPQELNQKVSYCILVCQGRKIVAFMDKNWNVYSIKYPKLNMLADTIFYKLRSYNGAISGVNDVLSTLLKNPTYKSVESFFERDETGEYTVFSGIIPSETQDNTNSYTLNILKTHEE